MEGPPDSTSYMQPTRETCARLRRALVLHDVVVSLRDHSQRPMAERDHIA